MNSLSKFIPKTYNGIVSKRVINMKWNEISSTAEFMKNIIYFLFFKKKLTGFSLHVIHLKKIF
jgi:hypothetical protein